MVLAATWTSEPIHVGGGDDLDSNAFDRATNSDSALCGVYYSVDVLLRDVCPTQSTAREFMGFVVVSNAVSCALGAFLVDRR